MLCLVLEHSYVRGLRWDLTYDDELLGRVVLDLSQIPPNETTSFRAELDTLGFVNLRATYRPEFIRPKVEQEGVACRS